MQKKYFCVQKTSANRLRSLADFFRVAAEDRKINWCADCGKTALRLKGRLNRLTTFTLVWCRLNA
jgi:hypothetical protein